jgi:hypothetical protein
MPTCECDFVCKSIEIDSIEHFNPGKGNRRRRNNNNRENKVEIDTNTKKDESKDYAKYKRELDRLSNPNLDNSYKSNRNRLANRYRRQRRRRAAFDRNMNYYKNIQTCPPCESVYNRLPQFYGNLLDNSFESAPIGYNYIQNNPWSLPTYYNNKRTQEQINTKSKFCDLLVSRIITGNEDLIDNYIEQCSIPPARCCTNIFGQVESVPI